MHPSKDGDPELVHLLSRCKTVGRRIKEVRQAPLSSTDLGNNMVPRNLADELVEAYLRTFEGVFRILHVPSFREQYAAYWKTLELRSNGDATVPPPASYFVMQLQLVLALGSAVHETGFPLKAKAARWVYEAHLWLILPPGKHRMTIPGIQNMCLLTLAQNVCGIDQDMAWITAGDLIRKAMYMGLHRDPRHLGVLTRFRAQMRRRLWATVMELNLQSAFDAGGPPLTSDMDHDVDPPGNYDDEELTDDIPDAPQQSGGSGQHNTAGEARKNSAGSAARVTQMSVALQLLESLPMRLRLLQHVNDFRAGDSYEETLRFNSELTRACRRLSRAMIDLQAASASTSTSPSASATASSATAWSPPSSSPTVNLFHTSVAELLVYRCFHTLHQPVITRSLTESKYHFSRKMHLDGALKMMQICRLSGPHRSEGPGAELVPGTTDLDRLLINGSGMFRNMTLQSVPGIVVELLECTMTNQSSAQDLGLGYLPAVNDYDLRATLEAGERLSIRRIEAGETNVKCISFSGACLAHIDAAAAGLDDKATEARLLESIRKSAAMALDALTRLAEREGVMAGPSPPPVDPFAATTSLPQSGQGQAPDPFLYGSPMMPDFFSDPMSVDMMSEWMMDIDGMLWGPPQPQMDMM